MTPRALWLPAAPLVLASTSATRRLILESAGIPVEAEPPGVDERAIEVAFGSSALDTARRLAAEKALAVARRRPGRIVVGADQTLALADDVLHKPRDREEARRQLEALAGRAHLLHSAFAVAQDGSLSHEGLDSARLTLRALERPALERYLDLAGDAVLRNVGGYQLEGLGIHLFERVEGEHATILGLPLLPLLAVFRGMRLLAF